MDHDKFDRVTVTSAEALWAWLAEHHTCQDSVYLVTWKAVHRDKYVSRDQVLDALIAYGWIDGRRLKLDEDRTMQLISPRQQQAWAASYQQRAARLEAEGRMQPSGRAILERARAAGTVDAMSDVDALVVPQDLQDRLTARSADVWWNQAAPSYRRNILRWIVSAKKPETRQRRIDTAVDHAARGQKVPNY